MEHKLIPAALLAVFIVLVGFYALTTIVEDSMEIYMEVKVEEARVGFNLDSDALRFGISPPGGVAERGIDIKNEKIYDIRTEIFAKGELSNWVRAFDNNFVVPAGETRNVTFAVDVPITAEEGTYNGTILILTRRVWI